MPEEGEVEQLCGREAPMVDGVDEGSRYGVVAGVPATRVPLLFPPSLSSNASAQTLSDRKKS